MRARPFLLPLLASVLLAACSGPTPPVTSTTGPSPTADVTSSPPGATKPRVVIPAGSPPATLQVTDLRPGKGTPAAAGDQLVVQYVGVAWSTRTQFDSSWDRNQPFPFVLGQGEVIPGWDQGLVGMRAGGRRELIVPPDLAYRSEGVPPLIGPDETLVFVIDLLTVNGQG